MKFNSLVIGNTSQLAHYFPEEYEKISSRDISVNIKLYEDKFYDRVYLSFAEQRLNEVKDISLYIYVNATFTLQLIEFFRKRANVVIAYGSCELWNNYFGEIDLNDRFDYDHNSPYVGYCISKQIMVEGIYRMKTNNVFILHPFNFNSIHRKPGFLFSKIFDSIMNKKKIEIGDTYFYRDLIHPKYVVERSILATEDEIVGSGRMIFINDFIRELYTKSGLNYDDYVSENFDKNLNPKKKILYLRSKEIKYNNLLEHTLNDFKLQDKI